MTSQSAERLTTINRQENAALIWAIADKLVGVYKPHEYGNVILPMCVIKRFEDTLAPTREAVWKKNEELGSMDDEIRVESRVKDVEDFWYDESETKIGYEIPFTREYYRYIAPRPAAEIFEHFRSLGEREQELMTKILGK